MTSARCVHCGTALDDLSRCPAACEILGPPWYQLPQRIQDDLHLIEMCCHEGWTWAG